MSNAIESFSLLLLVIMYTNFSNLNIRKNTAYQLKDNKDDG